MAASLKAASGAPEQQKRDSLDAPAHRLLGTTKPNAALASNAAPENPAAPVVKPQANSVPTSEQIRCRAYDIFCARHGGPGDAVGDWLTAESELRKAAQPDGQASGVKRQMALLALVDDDLVS